MVPRLSSANGRVPVAFLLEAVCRTGTDSRGVGGVRLACMQDPGLAHGSIERYREAFMALGKEHTQCMLYVVSCWLSL